MSYVSYSERLLNTLFFFKTIFSLLMRRIRGVKGTVWNVSYCVQNTFLACTHFTCSLITVAQVMSNYMIYTRNLVQGNQPILFEFYIDSDTRLRKQNSVLYNVYGKLLKKKTKQNKTERDPSNKMHLSN